MAKVKQILPEGCPRARIRATTRASRRSQEGVISDTLGDEARGMVVLDFEGHPQKCPNPFAHALVIAHFNDVYKVIRSCVTSGMTS